VEDDAAFLARAGLASRNISAIRSRLLASTARPPALQSDCGLGTAGQNCDLGQVFHTSEAFCRGCFIFRGMTDKELYGLLRHVLGVS